MTNFQEFLHMKPKYVTFFVLWVLLQRVEKIPSVQSLVATSRRPNICGAVIAFGFILISLCGSPQSVIAFINTRMHCVLPAPDGPRVIIPWRTHWVSYSWISFSTQAEWCTRPNSFTCSQNKLNTLIYVTETTFTASTTENTSPNSDDVPSSKG